MLKARSSGKCPTGGAHVSPRSTAPSPGSCNGLRGDLAFDVADFSPGGEVRAIEQVISKQAGNAAHRVHFVRRVTEDHVDVRADEGEGAVLIGEEYGIRNAAERGAVQLL